MINATLPQQSATVSASAGTGKTWLLVTRLIRLLLDGARPDGILAVTFTRKAAAEMQTRLAARLLELAQSDDSALRRLLGQIHAPADEVTVSRARQLYEELLRSPYPIKATTFHAFCQDILRRFPLEAGVAPGFELLDGEAELREAAWDALVAEAGTDPENETARALENLIETSGGLSGVRGALNDFLAHRSDWWAFTENQLDPLALAVEKLVDQLGVDPDENAAQGFFTDARTRELREFASLLDKHATDTNQRTVFELLAALDGEPSERFDRVAHIFLTQSGTPRARKESTAQKKSMGADNEARYLELHFRLCDAILAVRDIQRSQQTLLRSSAWYRAGARLLEHYQRLKAEQRLLDFADLEWKAYQLLNHADNAHWVQYKLDRRIDHLLIDEFQDTNPTQWRLILPLLEELAASSNERNRSVFLVGDSKQSIYRFRRADPELFNTAQAWLQRQLGAIDQPLNVSWRSAPAVIDFVNHLFGDGPLHKRLTHFEPHATHHQDLWGRVEVLPLIEPAPDIEREPRNTLRNPLKEPRVVPQDQRHLEEGRLIAARIRTLIEDGIAIGHENEARRIQYSDIMILLRRRTHAEVIEQALREANIPYASASRGTLLDSLEAQDMLALLEWLVAPFDNLALARVLRSPLFGCDHNDLIALAREERGNWRERLIFVGQQQPEGSTLQRAHALLERWREHAGIAPVHDLLDRVFCEGDVLRRYEAAYPAHLRHRAAANLNRFLELALEIDNGRYPSIGHFVARLRSLRQQDQEAPDEGTPTKAKARVRIMTIHASKGLEAPVVFLADTAGSHGAFKANQAVVDWPAAIARPECFLLAGKKEEHDPFMRRVLERHTTAEAREDANLLYVAVTRARQMLFITSCRPRRGEDLGWYGLIAEACDSSLDTPLIFESGRRPAITSATDGEKKQPTADPRLSQPLTLHPLEEIVTPSVAVEMADEGDKARTRGTIIHRLLQLLCEGESNVIQRVESELGVSNDTADLSVWFDEAQRVFRHPAFAHFFEPGKYTAAYNEVPIQYTASGRTVQGIIDRLVIEGDTVWLLDYKTHTASDIDTLATLTERYQAQIAHYLFGAQKLWPQKRVRGGLLFTAVLKWVEPPQPLPLPEGEGEGEQ